MSREIIDSLEIREVMTLLSAYATIRSFYEELYGSPMVAAKSNREYCVIRDTIRRLEGQYARIVHSIHD